MRKRHGWSSSSKMPARYVHLVNADVDDALFKHYGIKKEKTKDEGMPVICNICKQPNSFDATKCNQCGRPLTLEMAVRSDDETEERFASIEKKLEQKIAQMESRLTSLLPLALAAAQGSLTQAVQNQVRT
jgi:hypothetical protein